MVKSHRSPIAPVDIAAALKVVMSLVLLLSLPFLSFFLGAWLAITILVPIL